MNALDLIAQDNFIPMNKTLMKELGIETALLFSTLCGYQRYYGVEEFYREQTSIMEDTCMTEYAVRASTKELVDKELLIVTRKGCPSKNYYKINIDKLYEFIDIRNRTTTSIENDTTTSVKFDTTTSIENDTSNNKNNNNKNKDKKVYHLYGKFKRVKLTDEEYYRLVNDFTKTYIDEVIDNLDEYVESNNNKNKYTNFNLVLRKAIRENWFNRNQKQSISKTSSSFDMDDFFKRATNRK